MKRQWILPAILLVEIGLYYLCKQYDILLFPKMYSLETILILFGLAFFIQSLVGKDPYSLLPAALLVGIGLHFLIGQTISFWPNDLIAFLWIIAIGLFFQAVKTKSGLFQPITLLFIGLFLYFFSSIIEGLQPFKRIALFAETFWPVIFIVIGLYLLFVRKK